MKGVKLKCLSFGLLFALSSIASSIAFSDSAFANTYNYDDNISTTNQLFINARDCEPTEFTNNWQTLFQDSQYWGWESGKQEEYKTAFNNSVSNGSYIVLQLDSRIMHNNPGAERSINIVYSPGGLYLRWLDGVTHVMSPTGQQIYSSTFQQVNGCGGEITSWQSIRTSAVLIGEPGMKSTYKYINVFATSQNFDYNYPVDYGGDEIPQQPGSGDNNNNEIFPNIIAEVADKQISIMTRKHALIDSDYKVYFFIHNSTTDENPPPDYEQFAMSGNLIPDQWETFNVPSYGEYALDAVFVGTDGEQSSFTPPEGYKAVQGGTIIDVQGGIFGVDTDDMVCEPHQTPGAGQTCKYPSLEDSLFECSPTALDGCLKNIMYYIADWLGFPMHKGSPMTGQISRYRSESFGLMPIIDAPISVFTRMANNNHNCAPLVFNMAIFDTVSVPCISTIFQRGNLSPFYSVYQTIINGAVSYWVIMGLFRMVKESQDPQHDKIEVAKL